MGLKRNKTKRKKNNVRNAREKRSNDVDMKANHKGQGDNDRSR